MENQKQEALDVAEQLENGFITLGKTARALRYEAAETIRHLHARVEELEAMLDALGAGGVSAQRVTQAEAQQPTTGEPVLTVEKEPDYWSSGHFYEGNKPHINPTKVWHLPIGTKLYTHPAPSVPDGVVRDAERVDALYTALEVCSAELFAQCAHQGRAMKYVEQARKALAAEQCARAAITASKENK